MRGLHRHWRFLAGLAAGVAVAAVPASLTARLLAGAETMFAVYLLATIIVARRIDADDLRRHAQVEDEGVALILLIAVAAAAASLAAVFDALTTPGLAAWRRAAALLAVPLGWATVHTLFAFRYAHLWYAPDDAPDARGEEGGPADSRGGLEFGGEADPGLIEFLYYSFTIGMTAQTSDVGLTTSVMRRLTLTQSVIAFFYNTVLIALAVSAGVATLGG